jgi:hypothetical protein
VSLTYAKEIDVLRGTCRIVEVKLGVKRPHANNAAQTRELIYPA